MEWVWCNKLKHTIAKNDVVQYKIININFKKSKNVQRGIQDSSGNQRHVIQRQDQTWKTNTHNNEHKITKIIRTR